MRPILVLLAAISVTIGSNVAAAPAAGTATLAAPAVHDRVTGEGGSWRCAGNTCTGIADTRTNLAVAACTLIATANGRVTAFAAGPQPFGEAELKRCNRHVK